MKKIFKFLGRVKINFKKENAKMKNYFRQKKNKRGGKNSTKGLMKTDEALKVLNLEKLDINREQLDEKFKTMYENNALENGGSLYIQAKISIARNTLLNKLGVDLEENEKLEKMVEENMKTEEENKDAKENIENEENGNKNEKESKDEKESKNEKEKKNGDESKDQK